MRGLSWVYAGTSLYVSLGQAYLCGVINYSVNSLMQNTVLDKYDVWFYKEKKESFILCKNAISSYLYLWRTDDDILEFLNDIELCLSNRYEEIEDPEWSDGLLNLHGYLEPDHLTILSSEQVDGRKVIIWGKHTLATIPLVDFKELLLAWRNFRNSK